MNRAILGVGAGILVLAIALIAFPIAFTGQEQFDLEQEAGLYVIPPAMAVLLVGSISDDPRSTTVGGAFGNPDAAGSKSDERRGAARPNVGLTYHPREAVGCRYCSTVIAADLAQCPRCSRPRECRSCGRPLAILRDVASCTGCKRPEPLCNCPHLPPRPGTGAALGRRV